ncbi:MAG: leucine-rich repeat protein [Clostridia bacterium]|nr:leucine-rich repeat protein [Clostridia bacterium]
MKKKLLIITLLVIALTCIFAISVSANDYDTTRKATLDDGTEIALYDSEGNALTYYMDAGVLISVKTADVLLTGTTTIDSVQYVTFEFQNVTVANIVLANFQDEKLGDLQVFNTKFQGSQTLEYCYMPKTLERLSVNYDAANVFRETTKCKIVDFPVDCELNFIGKYSFSKAAALKEIYIPANLETFPEGSGWEWGCFWNCTSLTKVTFAENSKLKNLPTVTFRGCSALTNILLPDSVETVGSYVFRDAGIVNSPFSPNSNCTYIAKWAFAYCASLQNINIPRNATFQHDFNPENVGLFHNCTSLTEVNFHPDSIDTTYPAYMFNNCSSLKSIQLPNSMTKLSVRMFNNCTNLETIILGANIQGINELREYSDHNSFTYGCNSLKYVYLPKTLNIDAETHSNACHAFFSGGNITFYFDGTMDEATALQNSFKNNVTSCKDNGKITGATIISLEEYNNLESVDKCYIVYGGNTCQMFYNGEHKTGAPNCARCGELLYCTDPTHDLEVTVSYESFLENGIKSTRCKECNAQAITSTALPLFTCQGYSAAESGKGGISLGFKTNNDAIEDYVATTGKALKYGVFAVSQSKLGSNDIFDSQGNAATGVISAEITRTDISIFDIKIVGFEIDLQKSAGLALGAYVEISDGEAIEYSYMQNSEPSENSKYCFESFNDILAKLSTAA